MDLTYWYLFPIAVVIAAVASGGGVGGATFFSPLFVLALRLDPRVAIGVALLTEVFGFASGVYAHARAKAIDWWLARRLMLGSIPLAVIGSLLAGSIDSGTLKVILGVGLLGVALAFIRHHDHDEEDAAISRGDGVVEPAIPRRIDTADGEHYEYRVCRRSEGRWFAAVGGLFVGLISTGLGEMNSYALVKRCRVPTRVAIATSVVTVAFTAIAAGATHFVDFARQGGEVMDTVGSLVVFTIPGVIIGGQLGPRLLSRLPGDRLIRLLGWLFLAVAALTLYEAFG